MPHIVSIQVGKVREEGSPGATEPLQRFWSTAFYKTPVHEPVRVESLGITHDEVADHRFHGGVDKAVLAYAAEHYPLWLAELRRDDFLQPDDNECGLAAFGFGAMGENLCITEQSEQAVCIGDVYTLGDPAAGGVIVQVSQPRQPCWKISRRWKHRTLTKRVGQTGRTGWYYRVLQPGRIQTGDTVVLAERLHPDWNIARANDVLMGREADRFATSELMAIPELSADWKQSLA